MSTKLNGLSCRKFDFMIQIGLIREGKIPSDTRVALTPAQCKFLVKTQSNIRVFVQSSPTRCYSDVEYQRAGISVVDDISHCDILLGIKEVPINQLIPNKTYLFFSHTKKLQPYNQDLLRSIIEKKITLVDYECLEHEDGKRIIGFGFFAGVVGAHNGMMAYGKRTGAFQLPRIQSTQSLTDLVHTYFGLNLHPLKIAVTGSGRVAHGVVEVMNLMGIHEVEPEEYLNRDFSYPVYVHLKGRDLYAHKESGVYERDDFHHHPEKYRCLFSQYLPHTDVLMNGIYWDHSIPRLFENEDMCAPNFRMNTIADITDDMHGSVPCNLGDSTIDDPVYGVNRKTLVKTEPYLSDSIDIMAVGNLPNEMPRDASRYFGQQLIKFVLKDLIDGNSPLVDRATIVQQGQLTEPFAYMREYAGIK
jgi:saccharopine dehydrogenase (NAD+, L-lysine-forming)